MVSVEAGVAETYTISILPTSVGNRMEWQQMVLALPKRVMTQIVDFLL